MRVFRSYWLGLALLLTQLPLPAQIGNPGGYPGGQQMPPGNGGMGIPFPRRKKKDDQKIQLQSTSGMLRRVQKEQVVLEADDHRIISFKRDDKTHFLKEGNSIKPADLKPGDYIEIESSEDDEGFMTAVNVMWQQDGTQKDRQHAAEPVETSLAKSASERAKGDAKEGTDSDQAASKPASSTAPTPAGQPSPSAAAAVDDPNPADLNAPVKEEVKAVQIDPDDQGPPVLRRGGAAVHRETEAAPPASRPGPALTARNEPPPADPPPVASRPQVRGPMRPEEAVIEKSREEARNFLETLPNYFCQEVMTRYHSETQKANWQPIDVVSMALVYDKGEESYRNISINGKLTKKSMADLAGAWSTGEFGSVLADIFDPATAADFEFRRESRTAGRTALLYDFSVERDHSHWRIMVASQLIMPSYTGSIWIDKQTNRVLRIEMQATHIPEAFPIDKLEMATDYEFVRFGDLQYLVPVHAENLGCQKDSDNCTRNVIDFRNYHKYSGESSITFEK